MDKNHIDVSSDSLIKKAVDYYSDYNDLYHKMLAWYYYGIILKNGRQYSAAIIAFEKAEKEASELNDYYQLGLIFRNKAVIFGLTCNDKESIECGKKSISFFELADAPKYTAYSIFMLATAYSNGKQYQQADSLFLYIQEHYSDSQLLAYCNIRRAGILVDSNSNRESALNLYRQTPYKYYSYLDYARRALAHERLMEKDSADYWLTYAYSRCRSSTDSASVNYCRSHIFHMRGQNDPAFQLIKEVLAVEDSLTRIQLFQSVSGAQRDYYKSEALRQEEQLRNAKREKVLGWVIVLLLVLAGSSWFIILSRKKDRQLQEQISRLALQEKEIFRTNKANAHLLGSLFSTRIEHLDQMTRAYFNADDRQEKERLFKQIKQNVASLRNTPEAFSSLEDDLNRYCNGIMSKLRIQVPGINGNHLHIITLFFAGFPYEVVQLIMNSVSVESLKTARSRYRKAILAANAPDETFFLEMLEMKKRPQNNTNEVVEGC